MPNIMQERGERFNNENVRANFATFLGAAGTFDRFCFIAPVDGRVTGAYLVTDTTVTANDTNYWTFQISNGATGTMVADATDVAGGTLTADTPRLMVAAVLTASRNFSAGDELRFTGTETATAEDLVAAYLGVTIMWVPR